jgi:(p)ppGpp synthase/HD superfamily hydrolase
MNHSKPCHYSTRLIKRLKSLDDDNVLNFALIDKAIYWAKKYHDGQFRKSGEPFYTHPLEVAYMISEHDLTTNIIVTSVLHDIIEDTEVTAGMILDGFGWRIAEMVDRLTRDRPDGTKLSVEEILNNAYEKCDKEVLLIKVVDRIHNLITIESFDELKQKTSRSDTLSDFLPLLLKTECYKAIDLIEQLCVNNKDNSIFQDILTIKPIELNASFYNIKDWQFC